MSGNIAWEPGLNSLFQGLLAQVLWPAFQVWVNLHYSIPWVTHLVVLGVYFLVGKMHLSKEASPVTLQGEDSWSPS